MSKLQSLKTELAKRVETFGGYFEKLPAEDARSDPRREMMIGLGVVIGFFVILGGWAAFARLDAAVHAQGVIAVSGHRQAVQHRDGGIVREIMVREGAHVQQGQVLIELAGSEVEAREQSLFSQVAALEATRARLIAETVGAATVTPPAFFAGLDGEHKAEADAALAAQTAQMQARVTALASQQRILGQRQAQLGQQVEGYRRQQEAQNQQYTLLTQELEGVRRLEQQGLASTNRVRALERNLASLQGNAGEYDAMAARAEQTIGETRVQSLLLSQQRTADVAEEMRQTEMRLAELHPQLEAATGQLERLRIRAPAAGVVVGLRVFTPGGVIGAGDTLMEVVPQDRELVIEANVRPEDADDLTPGQRTEIRVLAFYQRDLPIVEGEVRQVSADQFVDERSGMSFFRAELTVPEEAVAAMERSHGRELTLRPGMPVEVVVPLRKRTALEYFLEPLNTVLWRSFREH